MHSGVGRIGEGIAARAGSQAPIASPFYNLANAARHELPDAVLLAADNLTNFDINALSAAEWREALRACKGMTLRQEVFGLDAEKCIADEKLAKNYADTDDDFLEFQKEQCIMLLQFRPFDNPYEYKQNFRCTIDMLSFHDGGWHRHSRQLFHQFHKLTRAS